MCFVHFDSEMCFAPQRRALFQHLNVQECSVPLSFFALLTSKCASRHNRVHFFDISTSKSGPNMVCFVHFDFEMCFTTACTFSTSQLPKVVRAWCALYILTSKCASRHNGVHFFDISTSKSGPTLRCFLHFDFEMCFAPQRRAIFISHLASWLCTRRFSEPTFQPSGASNHWKNTVFRDFPTFSRICVFFLLTLSLLWSSLFYSPLLSFLCPALLFICPYCRKFDF